MTEAEWLASKDPAAMLKSRQREWEKGGTYYEGIPDARLRAWVEACRGAAG